jgi:hypothetical protein
MLNDAIREHLELKRLRGADPGDVAREERDALGAMQREANPPQDQGAASNAVDGESAVSADAPAFDGHESADEPHAHGPGQETVEIDMGEEMADEELADDGPANEEPADDGLANESQATSRLRTGNRAAPVAHPAHSSPSSGESLEWEMPGEPTKGDGGEQPAEEEHVAGDEPVEDVLEETPDFLRETPEQDRLWFEQRPPRDFDFDE